MYDHKNDPIYKRMLRCIDPISGDVPSLPTDQFGILESLGPFLPDHYRTCFDNGMTWSTRLLCYPLKDPEKEEEEEECFMLVDSYTNSLRLNQIRPLKPLEETTVIIQRKVRKMRLKYTSSCNSRRNRTFSECYSISLKACQ